MALRIACLQTAPQPDFEHAAAAACALGEAAVRQGARCLFLPEYCGGLAMRDGQFAPPAAPVEQHPFVASMRDFARREGVWLQLGSVAVADPVEGESLRNRSLLIDERGRILAHYDKVHLFDVQLDRDQIYRESAAVLAGDRLCVAESPLGPMGMSICYDLRFAALYQALALAGARCVTVPAAFHPETGRAHWDVLCRARAIENGLWLIACCACGPIPGGGASYGHSLVVDPWGRVLADGGEGPGVVCADIDPAAVERARERIPRLNHIATWRAIDAPPPAGERANGTH